MSISSISPERVERFLAEQGLVRGNWLPVLLGLGISCWLVLPTSSWWVGAILVFLMLAAGGLALGRYWPLTGQALFAAGLMLAAGSGLVWTKSVLLGARPIPRAMAATIDAQVIGREVEPADGRTRLTVRAVLDDSGIVRTVRVNIPIERDRPEFAPTARLSMRVRLTPPSPPMLPGGYDFARTAWFAGLSATGSVIGEPQVLEPAHSGGGLAGLRARLSDYVRSRLGGAPGAIAAAFASGDRGSIDESDEAAMRDAGVTHLLSISGLHVSAVIAAVYFMVVRLLALSPWLALRVRLPLAAAGAGALAGIAYTLLTGSQVPTIRSCIGALLILAALALGREPLSLRMLAVAAFVVLVFWPEAAVDPGFQMSFASVVAIIAFNDSAPMRRFSARREHEGWFARTVRALAVVFLTGVVIELTLLPITLFHFHRAGLYGALVNVVAIPLTTFVIMPLEGLAFVADLVWAGGPFWWLCGKALSALIGLAHLAAAQPGAVTRFPWMGQASFGVALAGLLWLALWRGKARLWGFAPLAVWVFMLLTLRAPDVLVSGDGRYVGIAGEGPGLLILRGTTDGYGAQSLLESAGTGDDIRRIDQWPGADCSKDFCSVRLTRGGLDTTLLIARTQNIVARDALATACGLSDVVIADRRLPGFCRPRWLKLDRSFLAHSGGVTLDLSRRQITSVADTRGEQGWNRAFTR